MAEREKYQGTEMADLMWALMDKHSWEDKVISGYVYWEDCLEFADMLHKAGYRKVAEPEGTDIIKGEVV